MKKLLTVLTATLFIISVLFVGGCTNTGPTDTKEYDVSDFTGVNVHAPFEVEITQSDTYSVIVTAPEYWFKRITVEKTGSTLEVGTRFNFWTFWRSWGGRVEVKITMPGLEMLDMSGASSGTINGFESADYFKLIVSGASHLNIDAEAYESSVTVSGASGLTGDLETQDLRLEISGASSVELDGVADKMELEISGASRGVLEDLITQEAQIELSGASNAGVFVQGDMDVFISGASTLEYSGNPVVGILDVSGASTIRRR